MVIGNNAKIVQAMPTEWEQDTGVIPASIVSRTPGRIRFRVVPCSRQKDQLEQITRSLKERLGIYRVRTNAASGSITVFHALEHLSFDDVKAILRDLGIIFLEVTQREPIETKGKSEVAAGIANTVTDLNQRVGQATSGVVDLRFLLPLGFAALSLRQLVAKGLQLEIIPWYVLAWYSFDSFIKLHYTSEPQGKNNYRPRESN
ncbi:HMA2 domain-containing protein [Lyngbya aestuarii]|uniref:HMA2 domain-containing protein n=1 Tax=Lyngbya aestuarii TaxID=118322 RepID=UPI00403E3112